MFASLIFSGCYTYLALSDGAQLADVPPEPYYPPFPPPPPPGPPGNPDPAPRPITVIYPVEPGNGYERPKDTTILRDGGEGRIPETERRKM